ncbi:PREDICTED: F-box protein At1g30790-like [Camelina sativa]|uniref:F-box protein At1g30790-like n=1 Tax=Camelina sativa TaxID=90675 RepID=A0ABM0VYC3_CAMSA|nr:PREDICTED: F-box protein At1g30790-like [Camelina sativa]
MKRRDKDEKDKFSSASNKFDLKLIPAAKTSKEMQGVTSSYSLCESFVNSYYDVSAAKSRFIIAFSDGGSLFIFSPSHKGRESSYDNTFPELGWLAQLQLCFRPRRPWLYRLYVGGPFIICNPSMGKVTYLPLQGPRTSLGYDPVDDQFKALTLMSNPYQQHDFLEHEVLTLARGDSSSWTPNKVTSPPYHTATKAICINGFVYFGAWTTPTRDKNPMIVCFDVRFDQSACGCCVLGG